MASVKPKFQNFQVGGMPLGPLSMAAACCSVIYFLEKALLHSLESHIPTQYRVSAPRDTSLWCHQLT